LRWFLFVIVSIVMDPGGSSLFVKQRVGRSGQHVGQGKRVFRRNKGSTRSARAHVNMSGFCSKRSRGAGRRLTMSERIKLEMPHRVEVGHFVHQISRQTCKLRG